MSEPKDAAGLTKTEKDFVRNTWELVRQDIIGNGSDLFIRFFDENPTYQGLFKAIKNVPKAELRENKRFIAHLTSVMYTLSMIVDYIDETELLVEMLTKMANNHIRHKTTAEMFMNLKTTIIGAGQSGLGAFNACREQHFDAVVVYERSDSLCGLWANRADSGENNGEGTSRLMRNTTLNTSKEMTAFSNFPVPEHYPNFMHHSDMREYLSLYAEKIGIKDHVKLRHELIGCQQNADYDRTGRWRLTVRDIDNDRVFDEVFDGVIVCTGRFHRPIIPDIKNRQLFNGRVVHSNTLSDANEFEGQRVVVLGVGNSGIDAAVESAKVYLSSRTGCWIINRSAVKGTPTDTFGLRRCFHWLYEGWTYPMASRLIALYLNITQFDHKLYGLKPKHRLFSQQTIFGDELSIYINRGLITIKTNIQEFTKDGVIFEGETVETPCDAVIYGTGYYQSFPFLPEELRPELNPDLQLYKYMFYPHLKHAHTLGITSNALPVTSAANPLTEHQSRHFALLMADRCRLPSEKRMLRDIKRHKAWVSRHFPHNTNQVQYLKYMNELAVEMGVKPHLWKYAFTDPKLWWHLYFGPCVPFQYRLNAIIGAGQSGLGAFNACREQHFDAVVVYERSDSLCGLWANRDERVATDGGEESGARLLTTTTLNVSKEITAFSDFPAPENYPNFMHHSIWRKYLLLYAEKIGLKDHVKLRHELIGCQQNADYDRTGRWRLTVRDIDNDRVFDEVFDGVIVCTGRFHRPVIPDIKNRELYTGNVIHVNALSDTTGFEGQRVVVLGVGNSGIDIAVELSKVCKKVYLSSRTGCWVLSRTVLKGLPSDVFVLRRSLRWLFEGCTHLIGNRLITTYLNYALFNHKLYGLMPKHRFASRGPVCSDDLPKQIARGAITVKTGIREYTENGVIFE
ncbi:unnamed protein product, partial [Medioppia subpectinata]